MSEKSIKNPAQDEAAVYTLPALLYHDPDVYEQERQNIFAREWLLFGHESMWPEAGSYVARTVAGWPLLVIRDRQGTLKAFHNVCCHRASMVLAEGIGKTPLLRCMYHGWVYDDDGRLQKAPGFCEDDSAMCGRIALHPVHLEVWNNLVFICMAEDPPAYLDALGGLLAAAEGTDFSKFKFYKADTHAIACNWKTYVENYAEGYHIPYVHPELNKEVDFKTYQVKAGEKVARHHSQPKRGREDDAVNDGLWLWFWPHAALNVYRDGMNLELMVPTGPESCELQYYYLFQDLSDHEAIEKTIAMSAQTTEEDIKICEIVQKNLRAGIYQRGELSPRHEQSVIYFQDLIREALGLIDE